ncbi:MAG: hypothetical protein KatS3mg095_0334 [Candidatus Parcubacteria bacterium]|nr:MAG: hypothetical protein KatS3mg095_0334 [Candidatus Parcubacteria bacterium]
MFINKINQKNKFSLLFLIFILFFLIAPSTIAKIQITDLEEKLFKQLTNNDIKFIQEILKNEIDKNLKITGKLDKQTIQAIKKFQQKNNLSVTGKLDELTIKLILKKLNINLEKINQVQSEEVSSLPVSPPNFNYNTSTEITSLSEIEDCLNYEIKIISPQEKEIWYQGKEYNISWRIECFLKKQISPNEAPRHQIFDQQSNNQYQGGGSNTQVPADRLDTSTKLQEIPPIGKIETVPIQNLYIYLKYINNNSENYFEKIDYIGSVPIFKTNYNWKVPVNIPPGLYKIVISVSPYYNILDKYYDFDISDYKPTIEPNIFIYSESPYFEIASNFSSKKTIIIEELPGSPEVSCILPEMKRRDKMNEVYLLQLILAAKGYYPEKLITGYFGILTEKAVKNFQRNYVDPLGRSYKLPVDGIVSGETLKLIQDLVYEEYEECRDEKINNIPINYIDPTKVKLGEFVQIIPERNSIIDDEQLIVRLTKYDSNYKRNFTFWIKANKNDKGFYYFLMSTSSFVYCNFFEGRVICPEKGVIDEIPNNDYSGKYIVDIFNRYGVKSKRSFGLEVIRDERFNGIQIYPIFLSLEGIDYNLVPKGLQTSLTTYVFCNDNQIQVLQNKFYFELSSLPGLVGNLSLNLDQLKYCQKLSIGFKVPHFLSNLKDISDERYSSKIVLNLLNGDTNNDDIIDDQDNLNILFNYNSKILEDNGIKYDLNYDSQIDDKDLNIVLKNFGKKGDLKGIIIN